ncbi:MAG TPA: EF-P lysine aminoacylase GenX [Gammaproteobacteria bacterium]|nr:EF-P lysine aminoacylase GenX [Gammaproteobacteria bacterium]
MSPVPRTEAALWQPGASLDMLRLRAQLVARTRGFFETRGVLEVDTPLLARAGSTDPAIESFSVDDGEQTLWLQTSPEAFMKRLLAAGSGAIFQLARAFRTGELGTRHNPEFLLLEWYRPGFSLRELMQEVEDLVRELLAGHARLASAHCLAWADWFREGTGLDPWHSDAATLRAFCGAHLDHLPALDPEDLDAWRDLIVSHWLEPRLPPGLCFIYDYPASQAALARIRPGDPPLAERFELYLDGVELANGFHELADAAEQRQRFQAEQRRRRERDQAPVPADEHLLAALASGLPDCCGVALGFDRLLMRVAAVVRLDQVMPFAFDRV